MKYFIIIVFLNFFGAQIAMSDAIYDSVWTNSDGSKSNSVVTFYENTGPQKGVIGYYSGSQRNRIYGKFNSDQTIFDGYWVQDESSQKCSNKIDGSKFYGRLFINLKSNKEFEGFWSYCDETPYLSWQGLQRQEATKESKMQKLLFDRQKQIQVALNFFGYHVGVADGVFGKKTKNAIMQLQYCWEYADPYAVFVSGTHEFGILNESQQAFLLRSYKEAVDSGLISTGCSWFENLASANVETGIAIRANETNDKFCNYEGDLQKPVFYCSFGNGKWAKVCESYSENGVWNSFNYSYGAIGRSPELELNSEMTSSYFPEVVATTSIDYLKPSCTDPDGYQCETNHDMNYDFANTKGQFLFTNSEYEYLINTSSALGARDRIFDGNLIVNKINKSLPDYDPNYIETLVSLECDPDSTSNTVWDGSYVDTIVVNQGLCYVDSGDEGAGWEACLP